MYTKDGVQTEAFDPEEVLLEVSGLSKEGQFENISFDLKRGEILGISGLMGAGRTEVMETIFGLRKADKGSIRIKGRDVRVKNPGIAIRKGLALSRIHI